MKDILLMLSMRFDNISVFIVEYKEFAEKKYPGGNRRTRRKIPTCKRRHNIIDIAIEKVLLQY
jgi:hypothetical protein